MASITALRNELSKKKVEELEELFRDAGIEFFRTGSNLNTLTFECGEINGETIYGSIKFTLHKTGYSLDDEIEEYEMLLEEREKKEKDKARKAAKALKDREAREAKAKAKKVLEEREKERRKAILAAAREKEDNSSEAE